MKISWGEMKEENEGWMDTEKTEREVRVERKQVKEGVAINTMTHSFCGGYFLTAFIKGNLIILVQ